MVAELGVATDPVEQPVAEGGDLSWAKAATKVLQPHVEALWGIERETEAVRRLRRFLVPRLLGGELTVDQHVDDLLIQPETTDA